MTLDQAVALCLVDDLPRKDLTARFTEDADTLCELVTPHLWRAREVREQAAAAGIHVIPWNHRHYPTALLAISDCPPVLWYRGSLESLDAPAVAIVGSRAASAGALQIATQLATDLAARGATVVSGLARGVDSAAHRGALKTGRTVAVLGSGVDRIYPSEHTALAADIAIAGLVVSEHPPGTPPLPFHFPLRNRLISGLSRAVVVIEASEKSGSLITAACALEQGRDVMAVPGNVLTGRNRGGHALIRDGAKIVECADDVLEELGALLPGDGPRTDATRDVSVVSRDVVLRAMEGGQPYGLDDLVEVTGLDISRLLPRLSDLELRGLLCRVDGGRFIRPL